jgi:thiamine biosynthesis lipoprotein
MITTDVTSFSRVERHMHTTVSLAGTGIDDALADRFFARVRELEGILSRYRPSTDVSRLARGEVGLDDVAPEVRHVIAACEDLRARTGGDFEHEPGDPVLDVNAYAKGWIVDEAAIELRLAGAAFVVNAGGDVLASERRGPDGVPLAWRIGIQHPSDPDALVAVVSIAAGAVATSGTYERGEHLRTRPGAALVSVTVVGPELAEADALATAVFASGESPPSWWAGGVDPAYGLLTVDGGSRMRWLAPTAGQTRAMLANRV